MAKKKSNKKVLKQMRREYKDEKKFLDTGSQVNHTIDLFDDSDFISDETTLASKNIKVSDTQNMDLSIFDDLVGNLQEVGASEDELETVEVGIALLHALQMEEGSERTRVLEQLAKEHVHSFEAQWYYLMDSREQFTYQTIESYKTFANLTVQKLEEVTSPAWDHPLTGQYLDALTFLLTVYFEEGLLNLALDIMDILEPYVFEKGSPGYLHNLMASVYCSTFQPEFVLDMYRDRLSENVYDAGLNLYAVIASLMTGDSERANDLFEDLVREDPEFASALGNPQWFLDVMHHNQEECEGEHEHSIAHVLNPLGLFLADKAILINQLTDMYLEFQERQPNHLPEKNSSGPQDSTLSDLLKTLPQGNLDDLVHLFSEPSYEGLQFDKKRLLLNAGLRSFKDFEKKTEKEVLAIRGIGPATVRQLKENGVIFRKR
ncbi:hypothetical protein JEQ21_00820 [Streptococcus sp. 121]|uniref:hypothetical protein n=1 Tax=Streptococcus sp. 121 TaxID=2797637 RepID=UPI0018F1008B|nr:hypothetical protein [Streptococcus sp. 121]MBJ6745012.1 hypothetical protein [Streptococcus sp. 121]